MMPIEFPEHTCVYAKDQGDDYLPLPVYRREDDPFGLLTSCWKMTWKERIRVLFTGVVWCRTMTFRHPLQPVLLQVLKPDMPKKP